MAVMQQKIQWNKELSGTEGLCGRPQYVPERRKRDKSSYSLVCARSINILKQGRGGEPPRIVNLLLSDPSRVDGDRE